jgi:hypothetical protein
MLPTASPLFLYDCVVQSAAAFTDAGITRGLQTQQYNIFGIEAGGLFYNYAVAPAFACMMIQTGVCCPFHTLVCTTRFVSSWSFGLGLEMSFCL